ncbi:TetR/AcrR family transcriptional regulator [Saccharopolyspora erythraea]|uniref:TetR/AcrR family transcriptional regulator n=1 Tax=Saccharopolyspora erythraea TaxID=1836 RepID=UPI001BA8A9FF|nr:TetR family transcriptional regulator [Saccharopolyspora erythraea]QUH00805.1 TetR/AcrR family transcriptional regulator [Saccharopolyspora erythraea]
MSGGIEEEAPRRRGRRRSGEDTRAALVSAAREVFIEQGYDGATVRAIATRAGVDAAMVNHWFGGKAGLFTAAVSIPVNPAEVLPKILDGPRDRVAERMVRTFVTVWDREGGGAFAALVRSIATQETAVRMLREFITTVLFGGLVRELGMDRAELRASLCASQVVGLGMVRYVAALEPIASADAETVVAAVAPNLQRYLTGDLSDVPS